MIFGRVARIISQQLGVDATYIKPETDLFGDLEMDGLDAMELMMALEDAFDIEIVAGDLEQISTVNDLAGCVARKLPSIPVSPGLYRYLKQ